MDQLTSDEIGRLLVALEKRLLESPDVSGATKTYILIGVVVFNTLLMMYFNWDSIKRGKPSRATFNPEQLSRELSQLTRPLSASSELVATSAVSPPPSPENHGGAAGTMSPRAAAG